MERGKLVLIMGPTGSGKGTLEAHVLSLYPEVVVPVTSTTRAPRPGEVNEKDYYFFSKEEFEQRIADGWFLEWAIYGDNYYGAPKHEVIPAIEAGKLVLLEIEVQGVRKVCEIIPKEDRVIIYVEAGSWEDMERRVRSRAPITDAELEKRRKRYFDEVTFKPQADIVIENLDGKLEEAKKQIADFIGTIH